LPVPREWRTVCLDLENVANQFSTRQGNGSISKEIQMKTGNPTSLPNGRQKIHPHERTRPSAHCSLAAMVLFIMAGPFSITTKAMKAFKGKLA
jgi:hypothetical protein